MSTPDTRLQFDRISALIKKNEMTQAIALLKPILAKDPRNVEAWWLAANAAPTPEASIMACERLLALKPDFQPARKMIADFKLKQAAALLKEAQSPEALAILRPLVAEQPDNVDALWLMARAIPTPKEALEICQHILTLQPDHEGAKRLIATKQQNLAAAQARRQTKTAPEGHSRAWVGLALIGVFVLFAAGVFVVLSMLGVGVPKQVTHNLGAIGSSNVPRSDDFTSLLNDSPSGSGYHLYSDSLAADGQHDYTFIATANSSFMAIVIFPTASGDPTKAMTLLGTNGKIFALATSETVGRMTAAVISTQLPADGMYTLRLKGIPRVAQGAYTLELAVMDSYGY